MFSYQENYLQSPLMFYYIYFFLIEFPGNISKSNSNLPTKQSTRI